MGLGYMARVMGLRLGFGVGLGLELWGSGYGVRAMGLGLWDQGYSLGFTS